MLNKNGYGYVYCIINDLFPELCKIGMTYRTSHERNDELSKNTSIPQDFTLIYDIKVKNPQKYEKIIHNKLKDIRYNKKKNFLNVLQNQ